MSAEKKEPTDPDLARGVQVARLAEGRPLAGHVDGKAVLLTRFGDEFFAVGAACTHYGGPLAEGIVVDDTVRCPWHHACFSLRTGEMLRPPALRDLPCWKVERDSDTVRVTERLKAGRPEGMAVAERPRRPSGRNGRKLLESVVIVGAGAAGACAAETLRRDGYAGPIALIDPDGEAAYDRPNLSKDYLAGKAPEDWLPLRPPNFYIEQEIELVRGRRVAALDLRARRVLLDDGDARGFGALVLATGAEPVRLALPTPAGRELRYLRSLADCRAIIAAAENARQAVVLGASFIGMEVASSLRARGLEVHVVAPGARPFERTLGAEVGDLVRALHEEHGVVFHLGRKATGWDSAGVTLEDGSRVPADLVVAGVGVRPATALAEQAGIATDDGILVSRHLETEAPGVFAAGDVARFPDPASGESIRIEHWVVAQRQGRTAAHNLLGEREPFDAVPFFWTRQHDLKIAYVGHAPRWDAIEVDGSLSARDATITYHLAGETRAVVTVGRDRESLAAELEMERRLAGGAALGACGVVGPKADKDSP